MSLAFLFVGGGFLGAFSAAHSQTSAVHPLIPEPASVAWKDGFFPLTGETEIFYTDSVFRSDAEVFNDLLNRLTGLRLKSSYFAGPVRRGITLELAKPGSDSLGGYRMAVTDSQIRIIGRGPGIFYGLQTLIQLVPVDATGPKLVPCAEIKDAPRYPWRGMHLDVGRHFFPVSFVKRYIDLLSMYKMNMFHWHLTEDQGWRIEIKKYPKLSEVGGWRNGSMIGPYSQQQFDSVRYGGFYTQDEIRDVVAYAAKRHVTIIPEIEMPGHSTAALAAYPWLSCTGGPFEVGKQWGVYEDVYCTKDSVFDFLEDVLTEVCDLFPGPYVHIGGDECPKTRWKACPQCQAVIKKEGLKDEHELQSYFVERIEKFLNSKGKKVIGWDEILEGGLAPNAAVMSWRGTDGGIAAAKQKHHVVMTPYDYCYFDYYQADPAYEPLAIGGYCPIDTVYSYEPTPAALAPDEQQYILGAQGNVWTEYMTTPQTVEYMALPRMAALAEVVWTPRNLRDFQNFRQRLVAHFPVLDRLGVNYSKGVYGVDMKVQPAPNREGVVVALLSSLDSTGLHYSLDGSDPRPFSSGYSGPFNVGRSLVVKAGYFSHDELAGPVIIQPIIVTKSTGKDVIVTPPPKDPYVMDGPFTLVNGIRGDTTRHNRRWLGWQGTDVEAVVDLGDVDAISSVSLGVFDGIGSWIYLPKSISISSSKDGEEYTPIQTLSGDDIRKRGDELEVKFAAREARYVKIHAENAGKIPEGNPGAGNDSWLFIDEIMIR